MFLTLISSANNFFLECKQKKLNEWFAPEMKVITFQNTKKYKGKKHFAEKNYK